MSAVNFINDLSKYENGMAAALQHTSPYSNSLFIAIPEYKKNGSCSLKQGPRIADLYQSQKLAEDNLNLILSVYDLYDQSKYNRMLLMISNVIRFLKVRDFLNKNAKNAPAIIEETLYDRSQDRVILHQEKKDGIFEEYRCSLSEMHDQSKAKNCLIAESEYALDNNIDLLHKISKIVQLRINLEPSSEKRKHIDAMSSSEEISNH